MCELLIHIAPSNTATDPLILAGQYVPGQVVEIQPDGWAWTATETGQHTKLVKMPGISEAAMFSLMMGDPPPAPVNGVVSISTVPNVPRVRTSIIPGYAALDTKITGIDPVTWLAANVSAAPLIPNPQFQGGATGPTGPTGPTGATGATLGGAAQKIIGQSGATGGIAR
jgi:hypothetical protein